MESPNVIAVKLSSSGNSGGSGQRGDGPSSIKSPVHMSKPGLWNALIRTHHITSRKKVTKLKQAAALHAVFVLLRSGSSPGIMFVEGPEIGVEAWVAAVQKLRYKDYQLASRPAPVVVEDSTGVQESDAGRQGLHETESVRDFGEQMANRSIHAWWRKGMGYSQNDQL
ncbi:hypothetical protein LTR59_012500 [Friedmanniomyces endolithicus]|nr:hypothetical protein LTR94_013541 [Friedmanniomyces endolithicus]KAK0781402.1 hypothetical protein LTR59_012500 [Friedmanniomyces endolithicus]